MSLFGSTTVGADNRRLLLTVRAGRMFKKESDGLIHPDPRSGVLTLTMEASGVLDMKWEAITHGKEESSKDADSGPASESTIVMPGGAKFQKVEKCTTGRVFVIDFDTRQLFYWLQEQPDAERDATTFRAIKSAVEGTTRQGAGRSTAGASSSSSSGGGSGGGASSAVRADGAANQQSGGGAIQLAALNNILQNLGGSNAASATQPAGTSATAANSASAAGGAGAGGAAGVSAAQLAAAMGMAGQRTPNVDLYDVVSSPAAMAAYRENPAAYMSRIHEHLPKETDPSEDVGSHNVLINPEVQNAANVVDAAMQDPNGYREILNSFGLQPPAGVPPSTWGLLQAILAEKPAEGSPAASPSSSGDQKKDGGDDGGADNKAGDDAAPANNGGDEKK